MPPDLAHCYQSFERNTNISATVGETIHHYCLRHFLWKTELVQWSGFNITQKGKDYVNSLIDSVSVYTFCFAFKFRLKSMKMINSSCIKFILSTSFSLFRHLHVHMRFILRCSCVLLYLNVLKRTTTLMKSLFYKKELCKSWILIPVSSKSVEKWGNYGRLKNPIWLTSSRHFEYLISFYNFYNCLILSSLYHLYHLSFRRYAALYIRKIVLSKINANYPLVCLLF